MLKLKKNKYKINNSSELEIFLSTGMEVFSSKNIKKQNKKIKNKSIDNNSNTDAKIDELISNYEKINNDEKQKTYEKPYLEFIEIRDSFEKKPQNPELTIENKKIKKPMDETKEICFNIKDDESKTKELKFNVSKNKDSIQTIERKDNKKKEKKGFSLFKSKKTKNDAKKPEDSEKSPNIHKEKNKAKNKKGFFIKKKAIEKSDVQKKTQKQDDSSSKIKEETFEEERLIIDEDIKKVLLITDNLLEKLPEDVINDFIKSKDFELYERVINKIK